MKLLLPRTLARYVAFLLIAVSCGFTSPAVAEPDLNATHNASTLFLIGDSTMANKPVIPANAERGWGQMLQNYFKDSVRVENHAMNGRSSKSFLDEGRWAAITNKLRPGDWVLIQFGHNDEKKDDPKRGTTAFGSFQTNLIRYIRETQALGAHPMLATPVARRAFDTAGKLRETHGDYVKAVRAVAAEQNIPLLELNSRSAEIVLALGPERSKKLYLWVGRDEFPKLDAAKEDNTHFCAYGATRICDLAVDELEKAAPELAQHLNRGK